MADHCIEKPIFLNSILLLIGRNYSSEEKSVKSHAVNASLLLEKIYKEGFKDGLHKERMQKNFKSILSKEDIELLDSNQTNMVTICIKLSGAAVEKPTPISNQPGKKSY